MLDVVTFGEAMAVFVAAEPGDLGQVETFIRRLAGCESNVAVGVARLGHKVGWVSRLGRDPIGRYVRTVLDREGVDCSRVTEDPTRPTGLMMKARSINGSDPEIYYARKGTAASVLDPAALDAEYFRSARLLHVTGVGPTLSPSNMEFAFRAMDEMRAAGRKISFDPNLRPALWRSRDEMIAGINRLAAKADWVLPGIAEGTMLTGRDTPEGVARFYLDRGAEVVVVKLGARGAYFCHRNGEEGYTPGVRVERVVDTVGAGDGFAAGVLTGLLEDEPLSSATARGCRVGALAVQVVGDMDGLPTREQLGLPPLSPPAAGG